MALAVCNECKHQWLLAGLLGNAGNSVWYTVVQLAVIRIPGKHHLCAPVSFNAACIWVAAVQWPG